MRRAYRNGILYWIFSEVINGKVLARSSVTNRSAWYPISDFRL